MLFLTTTPRAFASETEVSWGCLGTGDGVGYLLVALMLAMLLFIRVHRRERSSAPPRTPRSSPRSHDELGKLLFEIVQRGDVAAYRGLFLMGLEIQEALGRGADAYIDARVPGMFEASLDQIAARVPPGATFDGSRVVLSDALAVRMRGATDDQTTLIVGTVTQVHGIHRMVQPGFVDSPAGASAKERPRR